MKKSEFPEKVRSGPAVVTLYRTTNRFSSPSKAGARKVVRKYPVYTLYYVHAGKAVRTRFNDYDQAKTEAKKGAHDCIWADESTPPNR